MHALTGAGTLFPLSLILTAATRLVAQVLEVHLNLLADLLYRGFTCLEETEGVTGYLSFSRTQWHIHWPLGVGSQIQSVAGASLDS